MASVNMASVKTAPAKTAPAKAELVKTASVKPAPMKTEPHLSIQVACAAADAHSFIAYQYATYPFRLSNNLRLDARDRHRAYAYVMTAAPGLLSGDDLRWVVDVGDRAAFYLTDQSATKVHSQPTDGAIAQMTYAFNVGAGAYFEYMPEPIILFSAANLTQHMNITLHPQGTLVLGEIIVPGRLARGEFYDFEQFLSRLVVRSPAGKVCFAETLRLMGNANSFKHSTLFSDLPILGNFVAIVPGVDLGQLARQLEKPACDRLQVCSSPLPGCHGLLIRAMSTQASLLKAYQRHLLGCIRQLTGHSPLPSIPK
ncbi:MAG: urease accessory protein UreD [Cyanobacteria bacterium P01_A01_bin.116]